MEKLKFPQNFLWGGATASEQAEGRGKTKKGLTVWDEFFAQKPEMFFEQIGPEITCDFANRYVDDLKLFAQIGANSIRLSFSWARLFPDGKTLNQEAVSYYHHLIQEAAKNKLILIMTIFHFDLPLWAQKKGGWANEEVINAYANFAKFIYQEYGNEVDYLVTMNEPSGPVLEGYLLQKHWPLVQDSKLMFQVGYGTILAHARAVNIFNQQFKGKIRAKLGLVFVCAWFYPKDNINFTKADQKAADIYNLIVNFAMLDPMVKGEFPQELKQFLSQENLLPTYTASQIAEIKQVKLDFLGLNYYAPMRVQAKNDHQNLLTKFGTPFEWKKARRNVFRGWEIYPQGLYDIIQVITKRYHNMPFYISENGMGVQQEWKYRDSQTGEIADDYRIAFLNEHLAWLHQAIKEGANCFGYHMWAIFDCWSWTNGFKNTYGFIEIDLKNNLTWRPKKSAHYLKQIASDNAINKNFSPIEKYLNLETVAFEPSH